MYPLCQILLKLKLIHFSFAHQRMDFSPVSLIFLVSCFMVLFSAGSNGQAYLKSDISVSCGSLGISAALNGKEWIGDKHPEFDSFIQISGTSTSTTCSRKFNLSDPVIYKTVRISHSKFMYTFHLYPGPKILRLHFNPSPYKSFTSFKDLFTVKAAQFTLLKNFSASLAAQALGVKTFTKEYYVSVEQNWPMEIVFSPSTSPLHGKTYAFINGIEIISVPAQLTYFHGGSFEAQVVGTSRVYVDTSSALELIYRLNFIRDSVLVGDELNTFGMRSTVALQRVNEQNIITWKRLVDVGFRYLVRIHFSKQGHLMFRVFINGIMTDSNTDIFTDRDENESLLYRDYLVVMKGRKQDGQRHLSISLQSTDEFIDEHGLLKGFEILKVSKIDNSLASLNLSPTTANDPSWIRWKYLSVLGLRDAIATVATAMIALVSIIVYKLREKLEADYGEVESKPSPRAERQCRRFSLTEIQSATRNFSDAFFIARGGFGEVYKGQIGEERETVAIKRLKSDSSQGLNEFLTEIETLSELRHINLVSLIGYCNEGREMILVYEYMCGGTLADHLYNIAGKNDHGSFLTWKQRLNICIGAGRGLDYLHTGHGIIHRDVKPSNILLDENFIAKVADFGLAKPEDRNKLQNHVSTNIKGTFGYFDPYYIGTRRLTRKSDTYAFGVVLLEVLCGRPAVDRMAGDDELSLTIWAQEKIEKGEINDIIDARLIGEILPDSLKTFTELAESCLHDEPRKRPTMAQVVVQLEFVLEQQEQRTFSKPNQETRAIDEVSSSDDETMSSVGIQQATVIDAETRSKDISDESSTGSKDGKKVKMYRPLHLWSWDAIWNRSKPSKITETISEALSGKNSSTALKEQLQLWSRDAIWNRSKPSKEKETISEALSKICGAGIKVPMFDFATISDATNQFSFPNKIGQGMFCSVYKAVLLTGEIYAVKRIPIVSRLHLNSFKNEMYLLPELQHSNIIKLEGYCILGEEAMLEYEFMANRSLENYIYDKKQRNLLRWALRFKIITGIARGIAYLHNDSGMRIIHRDIKPGNILLDNRMNPKITHFGLAKASKDEQSVVENSQVVKARKNCTATEASRRDYRSPEILNQGKLSIMSDVYSFGLTMLTIISGEEVFSRSRDKVDLAKHARRLWSAEKAINLVDESMQIEGSFLEEEVLRCIHVGLLCTQHQPLHRPTMTSVLKLLSGEESPLVADAGSGKRGWLLDPLVQ